MTTEESKARQNARLTFHPTRFEEALLASLHEFFPDMSIRMVAKLAFSYGLMHMMEAYGGLNKTTIIEETNKHGVVVRKEITK